MNPAPAAPSRIAVLGALMLLLASCVSKISRDYPERRLYALQAERTGAPAADALDAHLVVRRFRVSPRCQGRKLVYRVQDEVYEADFYNEYLADPAALTTDQVARWLDAAGLFRAVLPPGSAAEAAYSLEGVLTRMHADLRDGSGPAAVLELQVFLNRVDGLEPALLLSRSYHVEQPAGGAEPEALVRAWDVALADVCKRLEADLADVLATQAGS